MKHKNSDNNEKKDYNKNCTWKDLPDTVMIELTNYCNFSCIMCSNRLMKRKKGFMNSKTFKKTLDRCREAGIKQIKLYTTGESLAHPEFLKFWNLAITYPFLSVMISTNGGLLTETLLSELAKSKKLKIQFSFGGWDKKSYETRYLPGKFENAVKKIKSAAKIIKKARLPKNTLIVNGVVSRNNGAIKRCREFLKKQLLFDDSQLNIHYSSNWDQIVNKSNKKINRNGKHYCHIANTRLGVLYNGKVTACGCIDVNGDLIIGDIMKNSIKSIRAGKLFSKFKEKLDSGRLSSLICSRCDSLKALR